MKSVMVPNCNEPSCYKETVQMKDSPKWQLAMQSKMIALEKIQTWKLVKLPQAKNVLPCKWVYRYKITIHDGQTKYKARLVAKGFKQEKGIDFDEVFPPVVKMTILRPFLALVAKLDLVLHQMDVKIAFLHGDLDEEVYMQQLKGFVEKGKEALVCQLLKSIYGLIQSLRTWYHKSHKFMLSQGYKRSEFNHYLYTKQAKDGSWLILILYVDDMLTVDKHLEDISALKSKMAKSFDMKDMGERFNMDMGKALSVPLPTYVKLSKQDYPEFEDEKVEIEKIPYVSIVGSLIYAMIATNPDIAFEVEVVRSYMSNLGKKHWEVVEL
ncbi:hypothetical protein L7F22_027146 [Adiantum nelumboides]|nr:hypothetical protein [Adiantum nelumboides]